MRLLLALLIAALFATSAYADATITIALTGAGAANSSRSLVISDADGTRILTWARNTFSCDVTPIPNCTNAQAVQKAFDAELDRIRSNVLDYEGLAARNAVTPVTPK